MIDKIETMVERGTHFRGELDSLKLASPFTDLSPTIRPSKFYRAVVDLRPSGFDAMLHIDQKRYGTHKVELLETGKKGMAEIQDTLERIVECDLAGCRLGRVDLCADVRDVSLDWFRRHAYVQYKQFICAHAKVVEDEQTEMGKKVYQTLYFGKRPSCVRIYDKVAERVSHFQLWKRRQVRAAKKSWAGELANHCNCDAEPPSLVLPEFPTVQEWLAAELPQLKSDIVLPVASEAPVRFPVLTRVENQFGGRVPEVLRTIGQLQDNVFDFNPFARMKLVGGKVIPPGLFDRDEHERYRFGVLEWMSYMFVHQNWQELGAAQMRSMLNRDRNGKLYLDKMKEFLPVVDDDSPGISETELYDCYRDSISRQLAA